MIGESTLVTRTYTVDENNLPKGLWVDDEGAIYAAEKCNPPEAFGCKWRWAARNLEALGKGYMGQTLKEYFPINLEQFKGLL